MSVAPDRVALSALKGVGPALQQKLAQLGLYTLQDILFHLPHRYEDRTRITPLGQCRVGDAVVVEGRITSTMIDGGRRRSLLVRIQDESGTLALRFFHFSASQKRQIDEAESLRGYGEIRPGRAGLEIYHPEYQLDPAPFPPGQRPSLTPVYPLTEGFQQTRLRQLAAQALALLAQHPVQDWLPAALCR
ncbi:MAG: ATP-dependent DNA helicase RecG, partial [Gammaproteobacteria bacterium]|nr:ATP-dependent DNA helicase RecG [Gammaproteobacteria bacterium]